MYLGMVLVLTGIAFALGAPVAFLGPLLLALYLTRFQIMPEERKLHELFGQSYGDYCRRVRRWI